MPPKGKGKKGPPPPHSAAVGSSTPFVPPGACQTSRNRTNAFSNEFESHFRVPARLRNAPTPLVEAVNDFHFAMMNDLPRNEFYYKLLEQSITKGETGVLEIGAGSGLLSMMAAQLGAKWVVAVEGSEDMADLARRNIKANGLDDRVTVLTMLSSDLQVDDLPDRPDLLVSEIFGTLLLGESAHDYIDDVRRRILKPNARIIPQHGIQYAVPIECPLLQSICSVGTWNGLNLSGMTALKDTASCVFTKKYGFRMSSVPFKRLSEPVEVVKLDFAQGGAIPRRQTTKVVATEDGTAHAMMLYWKAEDSGLVMSTDPADTLDNFPRDLQWGQSLQLLEGPGSKDLPKDLVFTKGTDYGVDCLTSGDGVILQFAVLPLPAKKPEPKKAEATPAE